MEKISVKNKIIIIIFILLVSVLGGTLGGLIYGNWLGEWRSARDSGTESSLNNNSSQIIIRDAKNVTVQQDAQVADVVNNTERAMMGIFKKSAQDYDLTQPVGSGLVITSDGWLVVSWPNAESLGQNLTGFVVINKEKKIYQLDKVMVDNFSDLVFVRLKGANSLPVVNFAKALELKKGQAVITLSWIGETRLTIINQFVRPANPNFSDNPFKQIVISNTPSNALVAMDLSGKVVAWKRDQTMVTVDYITLAIDYLLNNKPISPTSLGVYYTDLDYVFSGKQIFGALITKDKKGLPAQSGVAVVKASIAELAGLKEGDIITAVNERELGRGVSLADVVATYKQGQKATIKYLRGTDNKEVTVEFK